MSRATIAVYHENLCGFAVEDIMRAADRCIRKCEFFPTVAELLAEIKALPRPVKPKLREIEDKRCDPKVHAMIVDLLKTMNVRKGR